MKNKSKTAIFTTIILLVFAAAMAGGMFKGKQRNNLGVCASGTIEVTELQLSPLVGGRIEKLYITSAQTLKKGDPVADLSLDGADRDVEMAKAALTAARSRLAELKAGFRSEEINKARAEVSMREAVYSQALKDSRRFDALAKDGIVAKRDAELYLEDAKAKQSALKMARETLSLLETGMRAETIAAAQAEMERAKAALFKAKTLIDYKKFRSPDDGTVLTKNYEEGDVVGAGAPIATLGKMDECWVKLYIPSTQLALIKLGQSAEVKIDAYPDRIYTAEVTEVSEKAEYNPRLSLSQGERENMVFRIKVSIDNNDGTLKPGMPADVIILNE